MGMVNEGAVRLIDNVEKVIAGKREVIELVVTAMLAGGHVLLEDVPGVGKTQMVSALARSCGGRFGRLQMTPDIMPGDITGFSMVNPSTGALELRKGAVFCNFLLADEINRSSPKAQSALLEVMEEQQVTIDGNTYQLPKPFVVLATQNPVETYGTYHLPEAQMDRFLMRLRIGYPERTDELTIMRGERLVSPAGLGEVITCDEIMGLRRQALEVSCTRAIEDYILDIVDATRNSEDIRLGVSPRGTLALHNAARAYALVKGRDYVLPDDVKHLASCVLAHRIILSPKGKAAHGDSAGALEKLLGQVSVPV
jgi:MoxR-like ATPase